MANTVSLYFDKRVSRSAAELAFFFTLTFFPLLICIHALADLFHLNEAPLLAMIANLIPKSSLTVLTDYLSFLSAILLLVILYVSILLLVTGDWFIAFLTQDLGVSSAVLSVWYWLRFLLLFALFFFILLFYYRIPVIRRKRHNRPPVIWGTLFSSMALVIVSMIFSWFIEMSSRYQLVYGSLAAMIILMLWLYLCGNIIILGSIINFVGEKYWETRRLGS